MVSQKVLIALLVAVIEVTIVASQNAVSPRLMGGVPINTLKRFPHHVTIQPAGDQKLCGGSILNNQWILTSAHCVGNSDRLQLHFEKLYMNNTYGSYSAVVNSDAVHIYPTYYDDIALVKLPMQLIFSSTIKAVEITSSSSVQLQNKLVVLPGFDANGESKELTYAMLNIVANSNCQHISGFDEYQQICTTGWGNNPNAPCLTDYGSGLISGWPSNPEVVGIYAYTGNDCSSSPAAYMDLLKYKSWIQSLIKT